MDPVFERGVGRAPFLLASCLPDLFGGPWRFSLIIGVTDRTERHYGGAAATEILVRDQIKAINQKFNAPKVFNRVFDFYVDQIYSFSTNVDAELAKAHRGYAYRMVYDGFPAHGGGWYGQYQAIYHAWDVTLLGGTFGSNATDGLTSEFGHARGAIDLYAMEVDAANNPVNAQDYRVSTASIMNYPYGINDWDAHSINLINKNGKKRAPRIDYITKAFPSGFEVRVNDAAGKPQAGVAIALYAVEWYKRAVSATALVQGRSDTAGRLVLGANPFGPGQPGNPWDIRYCNFLIEAARGTAKSYRWLPLDEVQNFSFATPGKSFVAPLTL